MSHIHSDGSRPRGRVVKRAEVSGKIAESFSFGDRTGQEYIVKLYIDDGVPTRGNRNHMIDPALKHAGIAHCSHQQYTGLLVILYA